MAFHAPRVKAQNVLLCPKWPVHHKSLCLSCCCFSCLTLLQPHKPSWTQEASSFCRDFFLAILSTWKVSTLDYHREHPHLCHVFPPLLLSKRGLTRTQYSISFPFLPLTSQNTWACCIFFLHIIYHLLTYQTNLLVFAYKFICLLLVSSH